MSEPTLNLPRSEIESKLGTFAGWGRGSDAGDRAYSSREQAMLNDAIDSGLRCFYYPEPAEGERNAHDWSFLHPVASLSLEEGESIVALPDDFGGFEGHVVTATTDDSNSPFRVEWRGDYPLLQMHATSPDSSGPPMYVAEQPLKGTTQDRSQRYQLLVYPVADMDYTLQVKYYINPNCLTGSHPYAYGGPQHAETILESCLAALENRLDDSMTVHTIRFKQRLSASIGMDRKNKPLKLGRNRDRSDDRYGPRMIHGLGAPCTYAGDEFE